MQNYLSQKEQDFATQLNAILEKKSLSRDKGLLFSAIDGFIKFYKTDNEELLEFVPYMFNGDFYDYFLSIQGFVKSFQLQNNASDLDYEDLYDFLKEVFDLKRGLLDA